jgi:hypothetical protein
MMLIDSERNVSRGKLLKFDTVFFILKVWIGAINCSWLFNILKI